MKLLIVDDHPVLRDGLSAMLCGLGPETAVLEAGDSAEGLNCVERHPDLDAVFLDLEMPGIGGLSALADFRRRRPELPVIILSVSEDPEDVRRAMAAGARGYVPKSAARHTLLSALRLVLAGAEYVPPLMLEAVALMPPPIGNWSAAPARLTQRQAEVLRLLSRGLANKEIARALGLSGKTVKVHVTAIFKTLDVVNRTQAAAVARDAGLV